MAIINIGSLSRLYKLLILLAVVSFSSMLYLITIINNENAEKHTMHSLDRMQLSFSQEDSTSSDLITLKFRKHDVCTEMSNSTARLMNITTENTIPIQWPAWIQAQCPEVIAHFSKFPYFTEFNGMPIMTTLYAAHSVCTLSLTVRIAASINTKVYLHAGSHLGAILHGGPIPWDDDIDAFLPFARRDEFLQKCNQTIFHADSKVECFLGHNAIKVSIVTNQSIDTTRSKWKSPFVDLFMFKIIDGKIREVGPTGKSRKQSYRLEDYFPTRPYYFAGIQIIGPRDIIPIRRYNLSRCVIADFNHRLERVSSYRGALDVDCCHLSKRLPFIYDKSFISNGRSTISIIDPTLYDFQFAKSTWNIPIKVRKRWFSKPDNQSNQLSLLLPNASVVEIENSFSDCGNINTLTVVEFNAQRGTHWFHAVDLLRSLKADIIILNEMDIGMARSDQQHTTRQLAATLKMNYAWGLEFVELTRGTKEEQDATEGTHNFLGLHGNAILSKCKMFEPVIYRNKNGQYFSRQKTFLNANGYEKRLGGRMGMFVTVVVGEKRVVVGSVHKLEGHHDQIRQYINKRPAIVGGNQDSNFCVNVGLKDVDDKNEFTWPASCNTTGNSRGDIVCTNLNTYMSSNLKPCSSKYGINVVLSSHAIKNVTFSVD